MNKSKEMRDRVKFLNSRQAELLTARSEYEDSWRNVCDYIYPQRGRLKGVLTGRNASDKIKSISRTATSALNTLRSGLHTGLASPSQSWFKLECSDKDLMKYGPVRDYTSGIEKTLFHFYSMSNFYRCLHVHYGELGGFGIGTLGFMAHSTNGFYCYPVTVGTYVGDVNHEDKVDTFIREFAMSARQMAQKFGEENLSEKVKSALRTSPDKKFVIVHSVTPREDYDPRKVDYLNMPFESLYYEKGNESQILSVGGYRTFPFLVSRWDVLGNSFYGEGPGMQALPDSRMLNEMCKSRMQAVHLALRPPMRVPSQYSKRLNLLPGGQNEVSQNEADSIKPLYEIRPDINAVTALIEEVKNDIKEIFYVDLFKMLANDHRSGTTAYEIAERNAEKLVLLGPVVERLQHELLSPAIERGIDILYELGAIPPGPPELEGKELKIEYISTLAQAQRRTAAQSVTEALEFVARGSQIFPEMRHKIDPIAAVDKYCESIGVPSSVTRSDDEVSQIINQEQKQIAAQQQKQQQQAALAQGVQVAESMSKMDTQAKNALTDALGAAQ